MLEALLVVAAIVVQMLLVAALAKERARRRLAESEAVFWESRADSWRQTAFAMKDGGPDAD